MRKIIFRGKRTDTGEMVFGDLIHGAGSKHGRMYILPVAHIYPKGCNELDGWEVDPDTVGQFTGLPDKNGKDIYEHDIVTWTDSDGNHRIDVVKWVNGGLCLCNRQYTVGNYGGLEVIGNIHDNPELLKGGEE